MPKKTDKRLIVALDIGTSKIAALVAEVSVDNHIEVIGFGTHSSRGLKRGVVVNIESTVHSIQRAIEEAEAMAGCTIRSAFAGIAGSHVRSLNSHGIVAIREREVLPADVDRVIDAAKAVAIPADQQIIHILPQEFIIDSQAGIKEPIGMSGVRLEASVHIVTGAVSAAQNITKCIHNCGLYVEDIILEQLASSHSVLTEDEKDLGVCLIDIGGGTTDIAVFAAGAIRHTAVIPIAGDQVTNDVAIALRTPTQNAEQIKIQYGTVLIDQIDPEVLIDVPSAAANRLPKKVFKHTLAQVIHARYEELFQLIRNELIRSGFKDLIAAGVVLTGGAAKLPGLIELAEQIFDIPVRLGVPQYVSGLSEISEDPAYATAVGLLIHGHRRQGHQTGFAFETSRRHIWHKMKDWFQGNF